MVIFYYLFLILLRGCAYKFSNFLKHISFFIYSEFLNLKIVSFNPQNYFSCFNYSPFSAIIIYFAKDYTWLLQ